MPLSSKYSLGFLCDWHKDRAKTWSRTPLSLFDAFRRRADIDLVDLPMKVSQLRKQWERIKAVRRFEGRFASTWLYSRSMTEAYAKAAYKSVARVSNLDAVISMGEYGMVPAPQFIYQDYSAAHLIADYEKNGAFPPLHEHFSLPTVKARGIHQQKTFDVAEAIFTMSEWERKCLIERRVAQPDKIFTVHAGIHVPVEPPANSRFEPADAHRTRRVLFVGRHFFVKAGDVVVKAVEHLVKSAPYKIHLTIAGPKEWPLEGDIPEWITFLGESGHQIIREELKSSDVLTLPSKFEAFGIAAIEALAAGVPVLGRNDFAMPEYIQPGINGDMVESDDPVEMADKLDVLMNTDTIRVSTAQGAAQIAKYYSWDRVADDMIRIMMSKTNRN